MSTAKLCEYCSKPLAPTPSQFALGMRTVTKRFCNHLCSAQWKNRDKRVELVCPACQKTFVAQRYRIESGQRVFCSAACYQQDHAAPELTCKTCGKSFFSSSYRSEQKYCSNACVPRIGEANPNYGKRHPKMFEHSAQFRLWLSKVRRLEGNPAWRGGSKTTGAWQHQSWVSKWAADHLINQCAVCGAAATATHHIIPGKYFSPRLLMQFRQNVLILCDLHQRHIVEAATTLLRQNKPRNIPFADRLPESILVALEQDGSVSSPLQGCDYSPLGNIGELIHSGRWKTYTAA